MNSGNALGNDNPTANLLPPHPLSPLQAGCALYIHCTAFCQDSGVGNHAHRQPADTDLINVIRNLAPSAVIIIRTAEQYIAFHAPRAILMVFQQQSVNFPATAANLLPAPSRAAANNNQQQLHRFEQRA